MRIRKLFVVLLSLSLLLPIPAFALDQGDMLQKIEALSKELERMKQQLQDMQKKEEAKEQRITDVEKKTEEASGSSWLEIGGNYRFRLDSLKGKVQDHMQYNSVLYSGANRLDLGQGMLGVNTFGQQTAFNAFNAKHNAVFQSMAANPNVPASWWAAPGVPKAGSHLWMPIRAENAYDLKNSSVMLNRFALDLKAKATEDVQVKTRLLMYKVFGNDFADKGNVAFGDKFVSMDGNSGHLPKDNSLLVDTAYATWSNIGGAPVWFSVGRRPSTGGIPTNLRQNREKTGTAGVPGLLVDYAFDGGTIGFAPDIDMLPGAYAKICYGRGMDSGFARSQGNYNVFGQEGRFNDVEFVGINVVPYDTDNLHLELQWQKGSNIFAYPGSSDPFGLGVQNTNIGDITWWGAVASGKVDKLGPGDLNWFVTGAISKTEPNDSGYVAPFAVWDNGTTVAGTTTPVVGATYQVNAKYGLLYDDPAFGGEKKNRTGNSIYLGARYDITSTGTKIGLEYNQGSKYWMAFTPASDDMWTSKLGTRGSVYEAYIIQKLNKKPISKRGDAFFRLGYQHYDFQYTGSGFWLGAPKKIADLDRNDPLDTQLLAPVKKADDIYFSFDVLF